MYKQDDKVEVGRLYIQFPPLPIYKLYNVQRVKNTQSISWPANWTSFMMKSVFMMHKEQFTALPSSRELFGRDVSRSLFTGNNLR